MRGHRIARQRVDLLTMLVQRAGPASHYARRGGQLADYGARRQCEARRGEKGANETHVRHRNRESQRCLIPEDSVASLGSQ